MRKYRSRTRQRYHVQYRWLRLNGGIPDGSHPFDPNEESDECACLSFDWRMAHFTGWINRQRREKFLMLWQAKAFREDYFR